MLQLILALAVGVLVFGSSIWVLIDAQRLRMTGGQGGLLSNSPTMWFVGCIGLWIVMFPLYFVARSRAIAAQTQAVPNVAIAGGVVFAPPPPPPSLHVQGRTGTLAWVGPTSLAVGIASIPVGVVFGVLATPLWLAGLVFGIWGVAEGGAGRKQAVGGIVASVVGLLTMLAAIVLMIMLLQGRWG